MGRALLFFAALKIVEGSTGSCLYKKTLVWLVWLVGFGYKW
jgi:hypothetical protein